MSIENQDEKGLFGRLSEILNSPLPGTEIPPVPKGAEPVTVEEDDDTIFGRIREILEQPLPGTEEITRQAESELSKNSAEKTIQTAPMNPFPGTSEDDEPPPWLIHEKLQFEQHQLNQRTQLLARQQQELAAFQRYQQNQLANFTTHQANEKAAFERHQSGRLAAVQQRQMMPPGWPQGMPPPPGWRPGMPLPPAPPAGWMPPGMKPNR